MYKNILIICTSNKDRSPALEKHFKVEFPNLSFRSAGINKYHCSTKGTHYLTQDDIDWSDFVVFCEQIHKDVVFKNYSLVDETELYKTKGGITLALGEYEKGNITSDYLQRATIKLKNILN